MKENDVEWSFPLATWRSQKIIRYLKRVKVKGCVTKRAFGSGKTSLEKLLKECQLQQKWSDLIG
jgi:hypothetical protein